MKVMGIRAVATVRDGRSLKGMMSADRKVFISDTHTHSGGHDGKQEVFQARDVLIWWEDGKR